MIPFLCRLGRLVSVLACRSALALWLCLGATGLHAQQPQLLQPVQQAPQPAAAPVLVSDRLDYLAADGTLWSAARSGGSFLLAPRDGSKPPFLSPAISFLAWDNTRWSARLEGNIFVVSGEAGAAPQRATEIGVLDWYQRRIALRWDAPIGKFSLTLRQ